MSWPKYWCVPLKPQMYNCTTICPVGPEGLKASEKRMSPLNGGKLCRALAFFVFFFLSWSWYLSGYLSDSVRGISICLSSLRAEYRVGVTTSCFVPNITRSVNFWCRRSRSAHSGFPTVDAEPQAESRTLNPFPPTLSLTAPSPLHQHMRNIEGEKKSPRMFFNVFFLSSLVGFSHYCERSAAVQSILTYLTTQGRVWNCIGTGTRW